MSAEPQADLGELDHREEVLYELAATGGDATEVLEPAEEAPDQTAFVVR